MIPRRAFPLLLSALACTAAAPAQSPEFYLRPNDHVLFYGDSITDQRHYTEIIECYVATRFPRLPVTFTNSGWGGDRVSGGQGGDIETRLRRDLLPYKPSVVTIMLGMNDGNYRPATAENDQAFFNGFRHIVETIRQADPQTRVTAIEPSPYDNVTRPMPPGSSTEAYNQVLVGYSKWIANYAQEAKLTVADGNTAFVAALQKADQLDPSVAEKILPDHIHPSFGGAMLLAEAVLKSWHGPALVSSVTFDASGSRPAVKASEHATVQAVAANEGALTWTETDDSLPLPFAQWSKMWGGGPTIDLAIQSSDIASALNEEPLRVTGLKSGSYKLAIDGREIGVYNDAALDHGVNLAALATPMSDQAMDVYKLVTEHGDLHYDRWRHIQVPLAEYNLASAQSTMSALDALETGVVEQERKAAQPKPHSFSLSLVQ